MSLDHEILKRTCADEFESLYRSLYQALLEHQDILLLARTGTEKLFSAVKAIQEQPTFSAHEPRIMLLLCNPGMVAELISSGIMEVEKIGMANIMPDKHTNNLIKQLISFPNLVSGTPAKIIQFIQKGYIDIHTFDAVIIEDVSYFQYLGYFDHLQYLLDTLDEHTKVIFTSRLENQLDLPIPLRNNVHIVNELRLKFPFKFHAFTIIADEAEKPETCFGLLCELNLRPTLVFCSHRGAVIRLEKFLLSKQLKAGSIHGGLSNEEYEQLMAMFRNGTIHVLITTDLATMDTKLPEIEYIVHYHLPLNSKSYQRRNQILLSQRSFGTAFHLIQEDEDQPDFIQTLPDVIHLNLNHQLPLNSWWSTIKLLVEGKGSLSQEDVINLMLTHGKLHRDEIGLFEVGEKCYYQAVSSKKADKAVKRLDGVHFNNSILYASVVDITYS